ncbi:hypothetical protein KSP40_PGU000394 [Platanthera guangdongensis]|uniref:Uncharacterized protein n=1 Tax=Platanthera guangdongensis TaxID=2320717 RepID=A0ABR2LPA3_9ASPA
MPEISTQVAIYFYILANYLEPKRSDGNHEVLRPSNGEEKPWETSNHMCQFCHLACAKLSHVCESTPACFAGKTNSRKSRIKPRLPSPHFPFLIAAAG